MHTASGVTVLILGFSLTLAPAYAQTSPQSGDKMQSESLSSKLNKTDGVIKPPSDVDPGIKVSPPAPHPGSTPVIPPSATGGDTAK